MKHRILSRRMRIKPLFIAMLAASLPLAANAAEQLRYHNDYRHTVKMVLAPTQANSKVGLRDEALARDFLSQHAEQFGLAKNLANLQLTKTRQSLTATHYYFQQVLNGVPVLHGEAIVSIGKKDGRVIRSYNNTYPSAGVINKSAKPALLAEQALETAWDYMQGSGSLRFKPSAELYYVNVADKLVLAYRTQISADQPRGAWEHFVDASSGEVLRAVRIDLPRKTAANPPEYGSLWPAAAANPAHRPLRESISMWQAKQEAKQPAVNALKVNGTALVFDPDPRTTQKSYALTNTSTVPDSAYLTKNLNDIEFSGGVFRLNGPWVRIVEIANPVSAPSTDADGNWTNKRGNNAFNDVNTYYHLDQSQRYIQAMGFTGGTAVLERAMDVDTNGLNGDDNSQYVYGGGGDYLEFGHGCVDDNEDADVILHEYGHAINYDINNNWDGGDTGAMGEGFGDYWAGSYSYSTTNGQVFDPNQVYTWDGPGCWDGRRMDMTQYQFSPAITYGAHEQVGSVLGDELWSTPLFQSLVELMRQGVPRDEVDQIILEAQFGLGANLTMTDMATATVAAAEALFPAGPHAGVFQSKFEQVNILAPTGNRPPIARVSQATINVSTGASVSLNASTSSDPDADSLTYLWEKTSGGTITLSGAASAQASFMAPSAADTLTFTVRVDDGNGASDIKTVQVNVTAPTSNGGGGSGGGGGGGSLEVLGLAVVAMLGLRRKRR
ncbi:hypothetical protein HPT27_07860 [Permianibacter sp. IMCC34836]|uniref:PKD domain-containing protein n=1 Tax=Permianibacter fluminis TaxID=2738515 RepID=UPI001556133B|nr:PepSY domain-containing protein [Permianibacter fluminis]NQD36938.1 hypothetical protein [Permianibacter fluminis]